MSCFVTKITNVKNQVINALEIPGWLEQVINKCALTVFSGIAIFFILEGVVRIPILKNSYTYMPIPNNIITMANTLKDLQRIAEIPIRYVLKSYYTEKLDFCLIVPILEELGNRLLFQELILKQGMNFLARKAKVSFDLDHRYFKILRVALSSFVFAAQHSWAFSRSPLINPYGAASLVYLVVLGGILGAAQEVTGNTAYPLALHVINNTMTYYL